MERKPYSVGVRKIPHRDRDVARAVLGGTGEERGFKDVIGADTHDDDGEFPIGSHCTYSVHLTEEEVDQFLDASNCRYVEPEQYANPLVSDIVEPEAETQPTATGSSAYAAAIPAARTLEWMRAVFNGSDNWHGRGIPIACLDQGTTAAVRNAMGMTLLGRRIFSSTQPAGEIHSLTDTVHGCLVAPNAVPFGGLIYDGLISEAEGYATYSGIAAGIRWAAASGAKLGNLSFGGSVGSDVMVDAIENAQQFDFQLYCAAGNESQPFPAYPAAYSAIYSNVHSIIAFDDRTDTPASFTNYSGGCSGCAPGVLVTSLTPQAGFVQWSGTSAATPAAVYMVARLMTGGRMSATQASVVMEQNLRQTGWGAKQGQGAFQILEPLLAGIAQYGTAGGSSASFLTMA